MAINLSVNLNKVALLRNSRGGDNPSPLRAAEVCVAAGCHGLTMHWREDNRHSRADDVRELRAYAEANNVEFNLEGDQRKELIELALEVKPSQFTLVPVTPGEITSDHGWDLPKETELIKKVLAPVKAAGIRTAIFVDPVPEMMELAAACDIDRVEVYTEPYAAAWGTDNQAQELARFKECAERATLAGLGVNAGHDLNLVNMPLVAREIPDLLEVSIGHALIADALHIGLAEAIKLYLAVAKGEQVTAPITRAHSGARKV